MQRERFDLKAETQGRWRGILSALGLNGVQISGKRTECPICRNGPKSDSFRFDDKEGRGTFFCNHCGAGTGIDLVMKMRGVDFKSALELIRPLVGAAAINVPKVERDTAPEAKEEMAALWKRATPLDGHDAGSRYLRSRGIDMAVWPASLRIVDELPLIEEGTTVRRLMPCLLAKFVAPDKKRAVLHRTWIPEPWMPGVKVARKMWRGEIPAGGAVQLGPAAEDMGVAEGLETAMSASLIHGVPVWACVGYVELVKFVPPPECKHLIIFGDNDASYTGQMAAYSLARRLALVPLEKRIRAEVRLPAYWDTGERVDWNDMRLAERERAA
ncbi:MAG TPA: toprim domain-containing protein [Hyphomicrobium sp.]|uniref:DUF7146 domain-containing protein n=1 Tax=Hyphomicrobium sp. TaxID=82 RepID=UPI002CC76B02|nr:toprim domain-containing protein [Hyphomicrobium sp.]HXE01601.1 toprim domain-containing protein [Hyphomicrobium sp.]